METPKFNLETIDTEKFVVLNGEEMTYVNGGQWSSWSNDTDSGSGCSFTSDTDR
jgi:hypothetical protein